MNVIHKFNEHIELNWTPIAIPGTLDGKQVLYLAAYSPISVIKELKRYETAEKTMIALAIAATKLARKNNIVPKSDRHDEF